MSDRTAIVAADVILTPSEVVDILCAEARADCERECALTEAFFDNAGKASAHNIGLIDALPEARNFRITFEKKGETKWSHVFLSEDLLRQLAIKEVTARQHRLMTTLADRLGVDELEIRLEG